MKVLLSHLYEWFPPPPSTGPLVFRWTIVTLQVPAHTSLLPPQRLFWPFPHQLASLPLMSRVPCSSLFIALIAHRALEWCVCRWWTPWGQRSCPSFIYSFLPLFILWRARHVLDAKVCSGSLQTSSHHVLTALVPLGEAGESNSSSDSHTLAEALMESGSPWNL